MSSNNIPSRVKSLSLAISQTILIAGGLSAGSLQAQAGPSCTVSANSGETLTINSKINGNACRDSQGAIVLSSGSGVNTVVDEAFGSDAIAVSAEADDYSASSTITLNGTNTTINANAYSEASSAEAYAIDVDVSNRYGNSTATIELSSSSVAVAATAKFAAEATGIEVETSSNGYYGPARHPVLLNPAPAAVVQIGSQPQPQPQPLAAIQVGLPPILSSADTLVELDDTDIDVSATSESYSQAVGIAADSNASGPNIDASTTVAISGGKTNVTAKVAGDGYVRDRENAAVGVYANSYSDDGVAATAVTLNESELNVEVDVAIDANGYGASVSFAAGIEAISRSYADNADTLVTLNSTALTVKAVSTHADESETTVVDVEGIYAYSYSSDGSAETNVVLNSGSSIDLSAEADEAIATAIIATSDSTYYGSSASVSLNDASISVSATGADEADAVAIYADALEVEIDIVDSTIDVTASGAVNNSRASGIEASGEAVSVTLTGSTLNVNGASGYGEGPRDISGGIHVNNHGKGGSITLNGSQIKVTSTGNGPSVGVLVYSEHFGKGGGEPFVVTLDSASSIDAQYAVAALSEGAILNNAGQITGNVIMENVNTSGSITGKVLAGELNVLAGGVVAGTSQSETLNVAAGGELQAIMTDDVDPEVAHFVAEKATLEDGAKVKVNGSSDLFNPELDGVSYRIVETADDTSLIADIEQLVLLSSGLISVEWEDCGAANLCVNVRALNLEELAIMDAASGNGVGAAASAQSVLEQLSGTETADAFMRVMERVVDTSSWEQIDGSGLGEGLIASRGSEGVVSRYVQRMMQQGRSSGEEFAGAQGLWVQALNANGDGDSENGVAGFDVDTTGLAIGYDAELKPGLIVGGVLSTTDTQVDADDNSSDVDTDTLMASVYGQWVQGPLFANMVMTYGRSDNDSSRFVVGDQAVADYDSDFLSIRMQGGKAFGFESGWQLRPRVELAYNHVDIDSYDETGSIAALSVDSQSYESLELGAGIEIAKPFIIEKSVLTPYFDLAVYHDFSNDQVQTTSRFAIGGNSFVTEGSDVEQTNVSATIGLGYATGANHTLKAAYEYFGNSSYDSASWMLRYSYSF